MWILIMWALLLFLAGIRSGIWAVGHFNRGEVAPGLVFLFLALAWLTASGALAMVAAGP